MANQIGLLLEDPDAIPLLELNAPAGDLNGREVYELPADPLITPLVMKRIALITALAGLGTGCVLSGGLIPLILGVALLCCLFMYVLGKLVAPCFNNSINSDSMLAIPEAELHIPPAPNINLRELPEYAEEHYPAGKDNITEVINTVESRRHFLATPPEGTRELTEWYDKVETLLKHIYYILLTKDVDPGLRDACLDELASVRGRCGTAYLMTAKYWYQILAGQEVPVQDLKTTILVLLARYRAQILQDFRTNQLHNSSVHAENQLLVVFGKEYGIPGYEFADPNDPYKPFDIDELHDAGGDYFWEQYTREAVINRIYDAVNRQFRSDRAHEIDRDQVNEALQHHLEELRLPKNFMAEEEDLDRRRIDFLYDGATVRPVAIEFLLIKLGILSPKGSYWV